ncbi:hypothetical protein GCM10020295_30800 [Streptomyces cinereospinus]
MNPACGAPRAVARRLPHTLSCPDPTGTPVDEHAVRTNLAPAGQAGSAARIRQGFSEDAETRAAVSDRSYGVIIVDGDHSAGASSRIFSGPRRQRRRARSRCSTTSATRTGRASRTPWTSTWRVRRLSYLGKAAVRLSAGF